MPRSRLSGVVLLALLAAAVQAPAQEEAEKVEWLRQHAVAVRSVEPADEDFSDLAPLAEWIGGARVVQLGEASHGDGTTFHAKARLLRFLHQQMGFDVLAWEAGFFDCARLDAALRGGAAPADAGAAGLYQMWWQSAEVQGLLAYVASTQASLRPIRTVGFDCRVSTEDNRARHFPEFVFAFFDRLDPRLISPQERTDLVAMSTGLVPRDYYQNPGPRHYNRQLPRRLVGEIDRRGEELARRAGADEIDFVRQSLVSLMNMDRALEQPRDGSGDGYGRDAAMAENLLWWLNGPLTGRKVVVWAHNYHVQEGFRLAGLEATAPPHAGPTGRFLAAALGDELFTVAFTSHHGSYAFAGEAPEEVPEPAMGSLEALLHAVGRPALLLNLAALPADHWLRQPVSASFYLYEALATDWPRLYDAVLFLDEQQPATLAAPAAAPAPAAGER